MADTLQSKLREIFNLRDGQFFGEYRYKNLHWFIQHHDQQPILMGFGDLRDEDILFIAENIADGVEFVGWNEHHGTEFQQTKTPMIRITSTDIKFRQQIVDEEGH